MNNKLHIAAPYIEHSGTEVRLCAEVQLRGKNQLLWFSVDKKYGGYLVDDRADAFVAVLLTTAMKDTADIVCEAPVSRRLLYQIRQYLIPILADNLPGYHRIELLAQPTDERLNCENAVATGWTGGVDSMYTLMRTVGAQSGHRLTHLMIANNGALEEPDNSAMLQKLVRKAENGVATELGLSVIGIQTNIQNLVSETFLSVAAYRQAAVILALQKLFGVYYSSAAYEFSRFSFDADNCFYYELLLFSNLQTDCTTFYSAYGAYSRAHKLKTLSDYPLAHRMLHPCIHPLPVKNCGRCGKCVRTVTALYGLGTLERFSEVFDIEEFERNKDWYMANTLAHRESQHYGEALYLLKQRGIEPSHNARRMARIMRAAAEVVDKNRDWLSEKLLGEGNE